MTGYIEQGGACVPKPKVCTAGQVYSERSVREYPPTPDGKPSEAAKQDLVATPPSCYDQCALDYAPGEGSTRGERDAQTHAWSIIHPKVIQTGANCTSSAADADKGLKWDTLQQTSTPAPTPCPAGQMPGEVNGSTVCKPSGATASSSSGSSSSSGNSVATGGEAAGSGGGSGGGSGTGNGSGSGATVIGTGGATNSSDTRITVCDQTSCTSTTTSTSSATPGTGTSAGGGGSGSGSGGTGGGTGTNGTNGSSTEDCARAAANAASAAAGGATCSNSTTTTKPVGEYCKEHPNEAACAGKTSSFNGNCAAGFTAKSDDAVQNAMAEEQFRQNCKLNPDPAETELAAAERQKTGNQTGNNPNNTSVSISPSSIDTSDALGGSPSCIADRTITIPVVNQAVTLKFSEWCQGMAALGNLLLAVGFLLAAVIVLRG